MGGEKLPETEDLPQARQQETKPLLNLSDYQDYKFTAFNNPCASDYEHPLGMEMPESDDPDAIMNYMSQWKVSAQGELASKSALDALNSPIFADSSPLNSEEQKAADKLENLVKEQLKSSNEDPDFDRRFDEINSLIGGIDKGSVDRVLSSINQSLEKDGHRMARSISTNEVWLGNKNNSGGYYLGTRLFKESCPTS